MYIKREVVKLFLLSMFFQSLVEDGPQYVNV